MNDIERVQSYLRALASRGNGLRRGRSVWEGYARGWGLQFGNLREQVSNDPLFIDACQAAGDRSILSADNIMNVFMIICAYLPKLAFGHIIEYGSFRGGSAIFMSYVAKRVLPGTQVYGLDTFCGMPQTDGEIDAHSSGDFAEVDIVEIRSYSNSLGLDNLSFVKGLFEDTAPGVLKEAGSVALVHIDCDIYSAVKYAYDVSRSYMVPGGYFIFDDATVSSCLGATEAVEELAIQRDGKFSEQIYPHFVFRHTLGIDA